ncbi:hypothetical protein FGO68_gene10239 [Halteria grandinella]|uniref:Tubulin-tyrosine ligase n=1 Tax=Halteria grandinella TaxID=5974 RepID=A0A8J8TA88_HALGN|nr:hypothetical protein FGO68_gene10239 [Halteria grandinella]
MKHCANNIWLVKPAAANQGRGIEIFNELGDIVKFISTRPKYTCWVVQKYIERPLLFKSRKFDIRVWVLLTHRHDIFMYQDGYLRTSSDSYELNSGNNYVHLTNNCLQQHGENYGKHEDGNTVSYTVLQDYIDEMYPERGLSVREHFIPRMKDMVIDTLLSVKTQINPNKRKNVFEFLGYDFLIDEDFRIWLIEVNTNPYIGTPNAFIGKTILHVIFYSWFASQDA